MKFQPRRRAEQSYFSDIMGILRRYFVEAGDVVTATVLGVPEWLDRYAWSAAQRMVMGVNADNAKDWRAAAHIGMQSAEIGAGLIGEMRGPVGRRVRELIDQNSLLIKSLPREAAVRAARQAARAAFVGQRAEETSGGGVFRHVARSRAMLIARTETAKANSALTRARSEELELPWYEWESSRDQSVRPSHRKMQGVLVRFADPPSPEGLIGLRDYGHYHAGETFNCRCWESPVLRLSALSWPHKVYADGAVRMMTLNQFKNSNRLEGVAA